MTVPDHLRQGVIQRAHNRCEYCLLSQFAQEATFHIDHIVPQSAGGPTELENLALACVTGSLSKGARQTALDPETGTNAPLFNPRRNNWRDHFRWDGIKIVGITPTGRASAEALLMNRPRVLDIRFEERERGRLGID
ncbi:MAG TPA: HNH endonuclease signature motif containing protein [Verrucomicrobiae bacterium]|nr:HNH endonuclease signature motif containing protein [Verrucomicrobiae bacterium]